MRRITSSNLAVAVACLALGFSAATILTFQHSEKWPEFYGTLIAALIAATTLIFGHYYQDHLARGRDEKSRTKERTTEAIDLCFWLQHCSHELEFVESALVRIKEKLMLEGKSSVTIDVNRFREIISSHFYAELLEKAKAASKLTPEIAGLITADLYKTFTVVDRIFLLRQAADDYRPSLEVIDKYIFVIGRRRTTLQDDAKLIEEYLIGKGALPRFPDMDSD